MTTSPPNGGHSSTSVFNALGSYADRIRESRRAGSALPSNGSAKTSIVSSSSVSPSSTPATRSASGRADAPSVASSTTAAQAAPLEDDGPWETVQSSRHRTKTKEEEKRSSGGSTSRDWRERPAAKEQPEEPERRSTSAKPATLKPASEGATATSSTAPAPVTRSALNATGTRNAWGLPSTIARPTPTTQPAAETTAKAEGPNLTVPTPPSPSIGETAATTTASIGSPNLSAETASSSTAPTSVMRADLEDDWRARPKQKEVDSEPEEAKEQEVVPAVSRQAAPPPAINAWDTRKKALGTTSEPTAATTPSLHAEQAKPTEATSAPIQFGTVTPQETTSALPAPNGEDAADGVKIAKKKKGSPTPVAAPAAAVPAMDAIAFPDLAQAAEVARAVEEKKGLTKAKKESENGSAGDESGAITGKKPKWTPIPASELLAAADEAAEASRKQSREAAARKKAAAKRGESEPASSSTSPATKGRKKETSEARGRGRSQRSVSGEEIRLPPQPQGSRGSSANFKPVFGSLQLGSDGGEEHVELKRDAPAANGGFSAPLSRQTSRQFRPPSPRSRTQLPSPASQTVPLEGQYMRFGSGPYSHRPSNTAPLPQHPFTGGGSAGLPRPPGRGNGRTSFSHPRGAARSGFRGGHMANKANMGPGPNGAGAPWSPTGGGVALPDTPFANGNLYQRGYGMGYQGMFPVAGPPQNFGQVMDPMQGYLGLGMYGRGAMPPAPMPQTSAPNLDPLRFYVLGQVEYYFSMQNLAMDFFLRQQMDSEGWIDIAMIASFNRIKSLTPDVAIVKEVMSVSSLLEVREEKVRLAGSEAQRWVLPDAKPSPWASSDPKSPAQVTSPHVHPHDPAFGVEEIPPAPKFVAADVENALMKSSAAATSVSSDSTAAGTTATTVTSVPPSSSASLLNGDESVDKDTPATSTNGDHEAEVKVE